MTKIVIPNPKYRSANTVLSFIGEAGSGDRIGTPRPANDNEKRSATDGFPVEVEFKEKRLPAYLWEYAGLFATVYERANMPEAPEHIFFDKNDMPGGEDNADHQGVTIHNTIGADFFEGCESLAGLNLIAAHVSTDPVVTAYIPPAAGLLIGAEIREDAKKICKLLQYRLAHLYEPLVDALVLGKTMKEIGLQFGGNSNNSAALGREKVLDGLKFVKLVFDDLIKEAEKAA